MRADRLFILGLCLSLLCCVLVAGCAQRGPEGVPPTAPATVPPIAPNARDCQAAPGQNAIDICYQQQAMAKNDSSFCARIAESDRKDWCYADIAVATNDTSLCVHVQRPGYKLRCDPSTKITSVGDGEVLMRIDTHSVRDLDAVTLYSNKRMTRFRSMSGPGSTPTTTIVQLSDSDYANIVGLFNDFLRTKANASTNYGPFYTKVESFKDGKRIDNMTLRSTPAVYDEIVMNNT